MNKKTLSILLIICLLFTIVCPLAAFAANGTAPRADSTGSTGTTNPLQEAVTTASAIQLAKPTVTVSETLALPEAERTAVAAAASSVESAALTEAAKAVPVTNADKAAAIEAFGDATAADKVTVVVAPYFDIQVLDYQTDTTTASCLVLDIAPMYVLKATTDVANMVEEDATNPDNINTITLKDTAKPLDLTGQNVTIALVLPDGFTANVVKHEKENEAKDVYYYTLTTDETTNKASFTVPNGFSKFTLMTNNDEATVKFNAGEVKEQTYKITDVNAALPTVNNSRFKGWNITVDGVTYENQDTLTEELWNAIAGKEVEAFAQYKSNGGGSYSGGGSSSGSTAITSSIVTSPDNNVRIDKDMMNSSIIDKVADAVADDKNVQLVGGSNSSVSIKAKKNGVTLTSFDDPLTVTVPISNAALRDVKDTSKLTLAQVTRDDNGNIVLTYVGGNYDAVKQAVTAFVDEPGDYVLIYDANVQKIELQISRRTVFVNGNTIANDVAPVIINSRTMVPLRVVSEALGCKVDWNEATRTVTVRQNGVTMSMVIDQVIAGFDAAPVIRDSRTMVPVRYISEELGANVIWVPATQQIVIVK